MKKIIIGLACVMVALTAMGLVAIWRLEPEMDGVDGLWMLKHQAVWCGFGIAATVFAACIPWHMWMNVVPGVAGLWAGLYCACLVYSPINGDCRWLPIGTFMLDMHLLAWPVLALSLAWLRTKFPFSTRKIILLSCIAMGLCTGARVMANPNLQARLAAFCGQSSIVEKLGYDMLAFDLTRWKFEAAVDESEWMGESKIVTVKDIPCPYTSGVLFSSAVRFGRVFSVGVLAFFVILVACFCGLWHWSNDAARRLYILVYGLPLAAFPVYSIAEGVGVAPLFGISIPLVSFGGTGILATGFGLGLLWSSVNRNDVHP